MPRTRLEALIAAGWTVAATEKLAVAEGESMKREDVQAFPVISKDGRVWLFVGSCYRSLSPEHARELASALVKCAIEADNCAIEASR